MEEFLAPLLVAMVRRATRVALVPTLTFSVPAAHPHQPPDHGAPYAFAELRQLERPRRSAESDVLLSFCQGSSAIAGPSEQHI